MKTKTLLLITFIILLSQQAFTQVQDLASLAQGKMVLGTPLFDTEKKVYGYFYLYRQEVNKESYNLEYVMLDKNLNKVLNGTFTCSILAERILQSRYATPVFDADLLGKDEIVIYKWMSYNYYLNLPYSYITISLKDNKVSKEFRYDGTNFTNLAETQDGLKEQEKAKNQDKNTIYPVYVYSKGKHTGFIAKEIHIKRIYSDKLPYLDKSFKFYDKDRKLVWSYDYNPNGTEKDYIQLIQIESKNDNLYFLQKHMIKNKIEEIKIVALDFNGQKKYEYVLSR